MRRLGREAGDVAHTAADGARARSALGFRPLTSLVAGLRRYEWVLERTRAAPLRKAG